MFNNTEKLNLRNQTHSASAVRYVSGLAKGVLWGIDRKAIFRASRACWLLLLFLTVSLEVQAQVTNSNISPKINSPLSRFGLGDFSPQYFIANSGMAGLSAAWQDPYHLNLQNPASLASLQATAFEAGVYGRRTTFQSGDASESNWSGNLQYLALGFPLRNTINQALDRQSNDWNAGMSVALLPYTQVGYDILLVDSLSEGVELSTNSLKGAGGTSRFRWGTGFRYKQLSVGVDIDFLFGKIINSRRVVFDSLGGALQTEFQDELSFRGTTWNFGAQYVYEFKKTNTSSGELESTGKRIILGAQVSNETNFNLEGTQFTRRFLGNIVSDTIFSNAAITGTGVLPSSYSVGLHFQDVNRLNIGV
ncbi:MAG: hypothetical protein AAGJ93_03720, partial [Bacteroidota bacterium]